MTIEIRNLSITSRVVQRQEREPDAAGPDDDGAPDAGAPAPEPWQAHARRLAAELLDLKRER